MIKELTFPKHTADFVNCYFKLPIIRKKIRCPYYKNDGKNKIKFGEKVAIGKGSPQEIISEVEKLIKRTPGPLKKMSVEEIRDFMKKKRIGIDCSGFVTRVLDYWCQEELQGKRLWQKLSISATSLKRLRYLIRPIENLDVRTIVSCQNSYPISKASEIEPGDLIHIDLCHILIVHKVIKDLQDKTKRIYYCHSSDYYDGVHRGEIRVKDEGEGLENQRWIEEDKGNNHSFKEYRRFQKSGVVRLNIFNKSYEH
jgi:hypothetical protein